MLKRCSKCNQTKDINEFSINKTKSDGHNYQCKQCHCDYSHTHYYSHKQKYINKAKSRNTIIVKQHQKLIYDIKSKSKCIHCSESCVACLDFHHINGKDKLANISRILTYSTKYLLKEISKCVVLCSNCHRKLHANIITISSVGEI